MIDTKPKSGSAAPPATPKHSPLRDLTSRRAKIGKFKLAVFHVWEDNYTYMWDGAERSGTVLKVLLVDTDQPTLYYHGEFKETKKLRPNTSKNGPRSFCVHTLQFYE